MEKEFLIKKYSISNIGIFGSFARGEENISSDIDILIDFNIYPDLFTFIEISNYLKFKLSRKVDLVTTNALRIELKNQILKEVIYI
jgi:predicted nucleotidyltransferase